MLKLYVMEGGYVNTEEELSKDGSEHGISGYYEVDISEEDYHNKMGNIVDRIVKDHCYYGKTLPTGYTSPKD